MILRKLFSQPRFRVAMGQLTMVAGQLCLVLGILLGRAVRLDGESWSWLYLLPANDFIAGLCLGVGIVLLLVSIPFNVLTLRERRSRSIE